MTPGLDFGTQLVWTTDVSLAPTRASQSSLTSGPLEQRVQEYASVPRRWQRHAVKPDAEDMAMDIGSVAQSVLLHVGSALGRKMGGGQAVSLSQLKLCNASLAGIARASKYVGNAAPS